MTLALRVSALATVLSQRIKLLFQRPGTITEVNSDLERHRHDKERDLVLLLLAIVAAYVILTMPANAMFIYFATHPDIESKEDISGGARFMTKLAQILEVLNYSSNFYLYCFMSYNVASLVKTKMKKMAGCAFPKNENIST